MAEVGRMQGMRMPWPPEELTSKPNSKDEKELAVGRGRCQRGRLQTEGKGCAKALGGEEWEGFGFCPKCSERPLENDKHVGNKMLWVELCSAPKRHVGDLTPSILECDLLWR